MEDLQIQFNEELARFSHFHKRLERSEQELFENKAWRFYSSKRFLANGIPEVSFRMKVIVSSYAAQITFGYDDVLLGHFHTIVMHPAPYLSEKVGTILRGETNLKGEIQLSWLDLAEGHNKINNGVNLALHEFAHAIDLENLTEGNEFQFIDAQSLLAFRMLAEGEMERISNGADHFFRPYAGTNISEFFAIAVENFFERPVDMEQHLPEVFSMLVEMLRLNPCKQFVRI